LIGCVGKYLIYLLVVCCGLCDHSAEQALTRAGGSGARLDGECRGVQILFCGSQASCIGIEFSA
jgi:hypothetical protein